MKRPVMFLSFVFCNIFVSYEAFKPILSRKICTCFLSKERNQDGDALDSLKLDVTKLGTREQERLLFIQKLTNEADEFAKAAGFKVSDDDDMEEKAVMDTNWSGQSDVEQTFASENNWNDVTNRLGLAFGDFFALFIFAAIGRSNHDEGLNVIDVLGTAAPFVVSWFSLSPFLGAFNRKATSTLNAVPIQIIPGIHQKLNSNKIKDNFVYNSSFPRMDRFFGSSIVNKRPHKR